MKKLYPDNGNGKSSYEIKFDIPQDLKDQGIQGFRIINENAFLSIENGPTVLFPFNMKNYSKTIDKMRDKLAVYKVDERLIDFYTVKITELLLIQLDIKTGNKKLINSEEERLKKETQFIIDAIKALRKRFKDIPFEVWEMERKNRYDTLRSTVEEKIPKAWEAIELLMTVKGIRHIEDIDLPLIVIIVGNPGTWKTLAIEMLRSWPSTYYKDK
ncbi:MAG: hypothetical protein ACRD8Z_22075, partial [Nitrososphaeraceae archaeon]